MKKHMFAMPFALVLAACGGSSDMPSAAELAAMPATANMPTGSASYAGVFQRTETYQETDTTGDGPYSGTYVDTMDFRMDADFNNNTVVATASNSTVTDSWTYSALPSGSTTPASNTKVTTYSGSMSGDGIISGSTFSIPEMDGDYFVMTSQKLNGVDQPLSSTVYTDSFYGIEGKFVGDDADYIYADKTWDGSSGTYTSTWQMVVTGEQQ